MCSHFLVSMIKLPNYACMFICQQCNGMHAPGFKAVLLSFSVMSLYFVNDNYDILFSLCHSGRGGAPTCISRCSVCALLSLCLCPNFCVCVLCVQCFNHCMF